MRALLRASSLVIGGIGVLGVLGGLGAGCAAVLGLDTRGTACATDVDCDLDKRCDEDTGLCSTGDRCEQGCPPGWRCAPETSACESFEWGHSFGGLQEDGFANIEVGFSSESTLGTVYACGFFSSSAVDIGGDQLTTDGRDVFLAALSLDRDPLWAVPVNPAAGFECQSLAASNGGFFLGLSSAEGVLVAEHDGVDGALVAAEEVVGAGRVRIAVTGLGQDYAALGVFEETFVLDGTPLNGAPADIVLAQFSDDGFGGLEWRDPVRFGGPGEDLVTAAAGGASFGEEEEIGLVYLAGSTEGGSFAGQELAAGGFLTHFVDDGLTLAHVFSVGFGPGSIDDVTVADNGDAVVAGTLATGDFIVARLAQDGLERWRVVFGGGAGGEGEGESEGASVAADSDGVTVIGAIEGPDDVGGISLAAGSFIARFDNDGTVVWAENFQEGRAPSQVALDGAGSMVLAGQADEAVEFPGGRIDPVSTSGDAWILKAAR